MVDDVNAINNEKMELNMKYVSAFHSRIPASYIVIASHDIGFQNKTFKLSFSTALCDCEISILLGRLYICTFQHMCLFEIFIRSLLLRE